MEIKYSSIVRKVKRNKRFIFVVVTFFTILSGIIIIYLIKSGLLYKVITAAVCALICLITYISYRNADKALAKMWENVGSPDIYTIDRILQSAVCLKDNDILMLITYNMLLDFHGMHACFLTDIIKLTKKEDDDDNDYYITVECENCKLRKFTLAFSKEKQRDKAFDMIVRAYNLAGGTRLIQ